MLFLYFLLTFALGQEPKVVVGADETIVVEAHKDIELYVAPIVMDVQSVEVEVVLSKKSVYSYTSSYWRQAKIKNERGTYEPISMQGKVKVYDAETIEYVWDNCNYRRDAKKCAYLNDHLLLETYITVDDHQITVNMILLNSDLTVINQSTYTSESKVRWIRQQEVTVVQQQGMGGSQTITHMPKEELPLKWLIPTNLMNQHIQQAALGLWVGTKIN